MFAVARCTPTPLACCDSQSIVFNRPPLPRAPARLAGHYVFLLGAYRLLYILNWVYRSFYETGYAHHPVVYLAGLVQTLLYADFFYYYALRYALACLPTPPRASAIDRWSKPGAANP